MQKEIIAAASVMKAPPSEATSGTTTLVPFFLLHESREQRFGFPPKLTFTIRNNKHVISDMTIINTPVMACLVVIQI